MSVAIKVAMFSERLYDQQHVPKGKYHYAKGTENTWGTQPYPSNRNKMLCSLFTADKKSHKIAWNLI